MNTVCPFKLKPSTFIRFTSTFILAVLLGQGSIFAQSRSNPDSDDQLPPRIPCDSGMEVNYIYHYKEKNIVPEDVSYLTTYTDTDGSMDTLTIQKLNLNNSRLGARLIKGIFPEMTHVDPKIFSHYHDGDVSTLYHKWTTGEIQKTQYLAGRKRNEYLHQKRVDRFNGFYRGHDRPYQMIILVKQYLHSDIYKAAEASEDHWRRNNYPEDYHPAVRIRVVVMDSKTDEPVLANVIEYPCDFRDHAQFAEILLGLLKQTRADMLGNPKEKPEE